MNTRTHAELATFIWSICNLLRGPYKRNEYRKVILPLTVLRRFDCVLEGTKEAVLAADAAYTGDSANVRRQLLEEAPGRPFYNTSRLDFGRLLDDPNNIAQNLSRYIRDFSDNVFEIMQRFEFELNNPGRTSLTPPSRQQTAAGVGQPVRRRSQLRDQRAPTHDEQSSLLGQRDMALTAGADTEVLPQLIERRAESRGRLEAPEAQHRQ